VEVRHHLGVPLEHGGGLGAALALGLPGPVAVQVEEAVVEAARGPAGGVLRIQGITGVEGGAGLGHGLDVPGAAIGVLREVHEDDHPLQLLQHLGAAA